MKKRVCIVFEETGETGVVDTGTGPRFNVLIEGVDPVRLAKIPETEWSTAEYWGVKCFGIVTRILRDTGALESIKRKPQ